MTGILFLLALALVMNSREGLAQNDHDGWKVLQALEKGYLAYTSKHDVHFRCYTLIRQSLDRTNNSATFAASFQLGDDTTRIDITNVAEVGKSTDNINLHFGWNGDPNELSITVLYSDYKTCYIATRSDDPQSCCMWVFFNTSKKDVESCLNRFKSKCGPDVINAYEEEKCGRPK